MLNIPLWAQQRIRIVDAETNEPLAYATISMANGRSGVANADGYCNLATAKDSTIYFSHIGYERLAIKGRDISSIIRLHPVPTMMRELVVTNTSAADVLRKAYKLLYNEYKRFKEEDSDYVLHASMIGEKTETRECALRAKSAVNLRDIALTINIPLLAEINTKFMQQAGLLNLIEAGVQTNSSRFWKKGIFPLNMPNAYQSNCIMTTGKDGNSVYAINMETLSKNKMAKYKSRPVMTGTLYVDAKTYQVLSFKGQISCANALSDTLSLPEQISIQMGYKHGNGFTEVSYIALQGDDGDQAFDATLFNTGRTLTVRFVMKGTVSIMDKSIKTKNTERQKKGWGKVPYWQFKTPFTETPRKIRRVDNLERP